MDDLRNKNIVVTGGAGFIGSELTAQLDAAEAHVTVIDNLVNGKAENIQGLSSRVRLVEADIRDAEAVARHTTGAELFFHLACLGVRHSIHSPEENQSVNAYGTLCALQVARSAQVERFVYVSSSEVYGTAQFVPMDENHPTMPETVYGGGKLAGEAYTRAFWRTYQFPTVVVRPFNSFGPRSHHEGDSGEVIPRFMLRLMANEPAIVFGDGLQTRDLSYVADTARGIMLAGVEQRAIGETINIGTGEQTRIVDLAGKIAAIVGAPNDLIRHDVDRPGDVRHLHACVDRSRTLLGFEPRTTLETGLQELYDWYLSLERPVQDLVAEQVLYNWDLAASDEH